MRKEYSLEEITILCSAINLKPEAYQWLLKNNCKELAALRDALVFNNQIAAAWLKNSGYLHLCALHSAFRNDESAVRYLLKNNKYLAAVISAMHNDKKAFGWLIKYKRVHYTLLAKALKELLEGEGEGNRITTLGSINENTNVNTGFEGFGGGDFGGGGAGGDW